MTVEEWARKIQARDRRSVARAITAIESGDAASIPLLKILFRSGSRAEVIGITGAPGAGKSTLVERLAASYRASGRRAGILAVDPTSSLSGGAILGDRIRMQRLATDEGIYIRSMATRGHLGGLAFATEDAVTVLEAAGSDVVLVETVGVGQDEIEIARLADTTVLLLVPGMGDDVQTLKAGVMEIADLFVVNKADRAGADRLEREITSMLSIAPRQDGWQTPVVRTTATTGEGVGALRQALDGFRAFCAQTPLGKRRELEKWRERLLAMLKQAVFARIVGPRLSAGLVDELAGEIVARRADPHSAVEELINKLEARDERRETSL
ncbi:MAG: methylmalonyl Co-A mutase-associated GTPase MeaB [Terriglobia bacterium]